MSDGLIKTVVLIFILVVLSGATIYVARGSKSPDTLVGPGP